MINIRDALIKYKNIAATPYTMEQIRNKINDEKSYIPLTTIFSKLGEFFLVESTDKSQAFIFDDERIFASWYFCNNDNDNYIIYIFNDSIKAITYQLILINSKTRDNLGHIL